MRMLLSAVLMTISLPLAAQGMTPDACLGQSMQEVAIKGALTVADLKKQGATERELIEKAMATDDQVQRAMLLAAVDKLYNGHSGISATATAMQLACYDAVSR